MALLLISAISAYVIALHAINTAYDRALYNSVLALADQIQSRDGKISLELPLAAQRMLLTDKDDRVYFLVRGPRGEFVAGHHGLPTPVEAGLPSRTPIGFDSVYIGQEIRISALYLPFENDRVLVEVAETRVKRTNMVWEILLGMLIPEVFLAFGAVALVWLGVTRGLAPLQRLREEITQRSARHLGPVQEDEAPDEVRPVVHALNALLRRLGETLDAQQRFIANAAHQLRTPLAGLQSQSELALTQPAAPELRHTLEQIHIAVVRAARLAKQLLALARAEPGGHRPDAMHPLDLADSARDLADEWVGRAIARHADLGFDLSSAPILGDAPLVRELLANLLDNALRYTPPNTRITVRTFVAAGQAVLQVEDDGPGIAPGEREKIFARFYRGDERNDEGCGLGLAIVREIAQAHHAVAAAKTPASGHGTLIEICFPSAG
jgi:two-component system sensor histidine kinase TctE